MSGTKAPSRTLLQLLIAEPAMTADGRVVPWFAQFLNRLVTYVGPVNSQNGMSLSEKLTQTLNTEIENVGSGGAPASTQSDVLALQSAARMVPPLPQMPAKAGLPPLPPLVPWLAPPFPYSDLPGELENLPIPIGCAGAVPAALQVVVPLTMALSLPANMAGTKGYALVAPTASAAFVLSYIRSGVTTAIGTLTFAAGAHTLSAITSAAISLLATDVLLFTGPAGADATLATATITFFFQRI